MYPSQRLGRCYMFDLLLTSGSATEFCGQPVIWGQEESLARHCVGLDGGLPQKVIRAQLASTPGTG